MKLLCGDDESHRVEPWGHDGRTAQMRGNHVYG